MLVDGRKVSHAKLEETRFEAVRRVHAGESPTAVARDMGLYTNRIFIWLAAYRSGGWDALRSRKAMGRPKRLAAKQIRWIYDTVTTKNPLQFKLPLALWTRAQIRTVIAQRFSIQLSLVSVGRLLAQLGLTVQRPLFRAYQQDSSFVERLLKEEYPKFRLQAKREKTEIFFEDESGVRSDLHSDTTWALKRKTLVVRVTGQRFSLNMMSAVSPRGELRFMVVRGAVGTAVFINFLKRLMQGQRRATFLIVDGHPSHRTKKDKEYVDSLQGKLRLFFFCRHILQSSTPMNSRGMTLRKMALPLHSCTDLQT